MLLRPGAPAPGPRWSGRRARPCDSSRRLPPRPAAAAEELHRWRLVVQPVAQRDELCHVVARTLS